MHLRQCCLGRQMSQLELVPLSLPLSLLGNRDIWPELIRRLSDLPLQTASS